MEVTSTKTLCDLCHPDGPLQLVQRQYGAMVTGQSETDVLPLRVLLHHFEIDGRIDLFAFKWETIAKTIDLSAQLWSRIQVPLDNPPLCWLRITDKTLPKMHRSDWFRQLRNCRECCADDAVTIPLREIDGGIDGMDVDSFENTTAFQMLEAIAELGCVTNIPCEQELKRIKCSVAPPGAGQRHSTAEKLRCASTLSGMMHRHIAAGGVDNRKEKRQCLVEEGVPLAAAQKKSKTNRRPSSRWNIVYSNHRLSEWDKLNPTATHLDRMRQKSMLAREWSTLPLHQKHAFQCQKAPQPRPGPTVPAPTSTLTPWQQEMMGSQSRWPLDPSLLPVTLEADGCRGCCCCCCC